MPKVAILVGATLACVSGLVRAGPSGSVPLNSINKAKPTEASENLCQMSPAQFPHLERHLPS